MFLNNLGIIFFLQGSTVIFFKQIIFFDKIFFKGAKCDSLKTKMFQILLK